MSSINRIVNVKPIITSNSNQLANNFKFMRECLDEFNKKYGKVNSSTRLAMQIEKLKGKIPEAELKNLELLKDDCEYKIGKYRGDLKDGLGQDLYMSRFKRAVEETNAMNCDDYAVMFQNDIFEKQGIKTDNIGLHMYENKKDGTIGESENRNHTITVKGIAKEGNLLDPDTWGPDAVIGDPWLNLVFSVKEGFDYFKKLLDIKENDKLVCWNANKFWFRA